MGDKLSSICWETVYEVVKTTFCVSIGTLWGRLFSLRNMCFVYHFGPLSRVFRHFVENYPAASSKLRSTCPKKYFHDKNFWRKNFFFQHWRTLSEKMSTFVKYVSAGLTKLHCTCPRGHFEANVFFFEEFCSFFFEYWATNFRLFAEENQRN